MFPTPPTEASAGQEGGGRLLAEISNRIVGLHKEFYGRGPDKAQTIYHGNVVVCLMEGGFTRVERTLFARGREQAVIDQRSEFQGATEQEFKGAIEELVGRKVKAYMSTTHQGPDIMCEVFVLDDVPPEEPPEAA